jgi:hypothetical protein
VGGAAILEIENRNHHKERRGLRTIDPRIRSMLRLPNRLYTLPTKAKSPDEHNPWATIITITPSHLTDLAMNKPRRTKAI